PLPSTPMSGPSCRRRSSSTRCPTSLPPACRKRRIIASPWRTIACCWWARAGSWSACLGTPTHRWAKAAAGLSAFLFDAFQCRELGPTLPLVGRVASTQASLRSLRCEPGGGGAVMLESRPKDGPPPPTPPHKGEGSRPSSPPALIHFLRAAGRFPLQIFRAVELTSSA